MAAQPNFLLHERYKPYHEQPNGLSWFRIYEMLVYFGSKLEATANNTHIRSTESNDYDRLSKYGLLKKKHGGYYLLTPLGCKVYQVLKNLGNSMFENHYKYKALRINLRDYIMTDEKPLPKHNGVWQIAALRFAEKYWPAGIGEFKPEFIDHRSFVERLKIMERMGEIIPVHEDGKREWKYYGFTATGEYAPFEPEVLANFMGFFSAKDKAYDCHLSIDAGLIEKNDSGMLSPTSAGWCFAFVLRQLNMMNFLLPSEIKCLKKASKRAQQQNIAEI